ncbi:MAG: substrate-binding domain-containing protein [Christensenellaceae bacterium]|mgnify:CR=1 FL=1|nr:substrate-binding domain-containing protein [Christensenellaceae bacterium]
MKKVFLGIVVFTLVCGMLLMSACSDQGGAPSPASQAPQAPAEESKAPEAPAEQPGEAPEAPAGGITLGSGYTIMTTVKLLGIGWFDRTETMVKEFAANTGNNCYQTGPSETDAAATNQLLEDAIATGVDAICIIPFSPSSADPVLAKAREQGIVVISHEATDQVECDYDIEAFDNYAYGAILMDYLAKGMNEEGEYYTTVGGLTATSQNQWEEGGYNRQQEKYPNMTAVKRKIETNDEQAKSKAIMAEMINTYPNLKGFQGATSQDAPGAAEAVAEAGLIGKITVVGTSMPSIASKQLEDGSLYAMALWDPGLTVYAMHTLAVMMLDGNGDLINEDLNLSEASGYPGGLPGYEKLMFTDGAGDGKIIYANATLVIDSVEKMNQYKDANGNYYL